MRSGSFLPTSFRGMLALAGLGLVAVTGFTPKSASGAGAALMGLALAIWTGLAAEWCWRRFDAQPVAIRRLIVWPIALLAVLFVLVSVSLAGQAVGVLPVPSATPTP